MFSRMRLGTRIGIGFGVLMALLVIVGLWCLHQINDLYEINQSLYRHPFTVSNAVLRIENNVVKIQRNLKDIVLTDDPESVKRYTLEIDNLERESFQDFKIISERFLGEKSRHLAALEKFKEWKPIRESVILMMDQGHRKEAAELTRGEGANHVDSILFAMTDLHNFARNKAATFYKEAQERATFARNLMYAVLLIAVGLGIAFTIVFARKVLKTEEELRDDKEFMESTLDSLTDTFFVFDPKTGEVLQWNQAFREISGYSDEEIAANKAPETYYDENDLAKTAEFLRSLGGSRSGDIRLNFITKDGKRVPTEYRAVLVNDQHGNPKHVISVGRDITERLEAESALRESEALLNEVGEIAKIGGWEMDLRTRKAKWTRETYLIVGIEPGQPIPGPDEHVDYYLPECRELVSKAMQELIEDDKPLDFEAQIKNLRGEVRWCRAMGRAVRENGEAVRLVGTFQDITEQKQTEEKMALLDAQLRQAQKMEALGTLAGGVAHDFNNILSAIIGYSELALDDIDKENPLRLNMEQILKSSWRARNLVAQLLAYSRKQVLELKTLSINEVVEENLPMLRRIIGEDIELVTYLDEDAGATRADFNQLEQVLMNLVANARDAMVGGGVLSIETSSVILDEDYLDSHSDAITGPHVILSVSDNGPGMDQETKARIFDPFFTTKQTGKGTGLGLAMVYGIVKQHGGSIYVYSEQGRGTTFKIYLPQVRGEVEGHVQRTSMSDLPMGNERVLLAEDDELVREFLLSTLERLGYQVLAADSGPSALELIKEEGQGVDLLVTDVIMPKMSGKELAGQLILDFPDLKVLYLSGYTDNVIAHHGVLDPGVAFLQKPVTIMSLARKVRDVLDG
jgi:two-component system cell cycle sensor histidine kinase/response regulator CckA